MLFYDVEQDEFVTVEQLEDEYNQFRLDEPENYDYPFSDYIENCLTKNNGTLEIVPQQKRRK